MKPTKIEIYQNLESKQKDIQSIKCNCSSLQN
jgi:hypothetical protein